MIREQTSNGNRLQISDEGSRTRDRRRGASARDRRCSMWRRRGQRKEAAPATEEKKPAASKAVRVVGGSRRDGSMRERERDLKGGRRKSEARGKADSSECASEFNPKK